MISQYLSADELQSEWFTFAVNLIQSVANTTFASSIVLLKLRLTIAGGHMEFAEENRK